MPRHPKLASTAAFCAGRQGYGDQAGLERAQVRQSRLGDLRQNHRHPIVALQPES
jgi:hypothetical protein